MNTNFVARVAKTQAGQLLHTQALETDERTLMQKAFDQNINKARLTINSTLNIEDGYTFVAELDAASNRMAKRAVIVKWQALANLITAMNKVKETSPMSQFRLSKAAVAAREAGWMVENTKYGQIEHVYWPVDAD